MNMDCNKKKLGKASILSVKPVNSPSFFVTAGQKNSEGDFRYLSGVALLNYIMRQPASKMVRKQ